MIITKRHVSRRAVLKGMGVTVALPFLDAMTPAGTALANAAAKGKLRFVASRPRPDLLWQMHQRLAERDLLGLCRVGHIRSPHQ